MKTDLATAISASILGVLIAYFVTGMFIGEITEVTIKTVDGNVDVNITEPNPEIFNYRALNPTVEVYVGSCAEYGDFGQCIDEMTEEDITNIPGFSPSLIPGYQDEENSQSFENDQLPTNQDTTNQDSTEGGNGTTN